jgi:teichoic acid transport system permease protein
VTGTGGVSLAEFAMSHGLTKSAARPPLRRYIVSVWQRRNFIWAFASARNISMYNESRLGQLWQILTPLLNAGVYYLIFGLLLDTKRGIHDFIPFLVTGVFVFGFTQRSVQSGSRSITDNLPLIRALHFPRASLALAYAVTELQQLLLSLVVLFAIVFSFGEPAKFNMVLIIPVVLMQLMFNLGISLVMARWGAFTPDISQLLPFVMRTWMYFSGVIFSLPTLTDKFKSHPWIEKVMELNPGYIYPELARRSLLGQYNHFVHAKKHEKVVSEVQRLHGVDYVNHWVKTTGGLGAGSSLHLWIYALVWAIVLLGGGFLYFYRAEERYGRG